MKPTPTDGMGRLPVERQSSYKTGTQVDGLFAQGRHAEALVLVHQFQKKWPKNLRIKLREAKLVEVLNGFGAALPIWEWLSPRQIKNFTVQRRYLRALSRVQGKADAKTMANRLLKKYNQPTDRDLFQALIELEVGQQNNGLARLQDLAITKGNPDALEAVLRHHLLNKEFEEANRVIEEVDIKDETFMHLSSLVEAINRNLSSFKPLGAEGEKHKALAKKFLKTKTRTNSIAVTPRQEVSMITVNRLGDSIFDTQLAEFALQLSRRSNDMSDCLEEVALIVGNVSESNFDHIDRLRRARIKVTNLALYPAKRANGTYDPTKGLDEALQGFPKALVRQTKAMALRFFDTPPGTVYVWKPEILAATIFAAKIAKIPTPVLLGIGDTLQSADDITRGILAAALEHNAIEIVYDTNITNQRLTAMQDINEDAIKQIKLPTVIKSPDMILLEDNLSAFSKFLKKRKSDIFIFGCLDLDPISMKRWVNLIGPIARSNQQLNFLLACPVATHEELQEALETSGLAARTLVLDSDTNLRPLMMRSRSVVIISEQMAVYYVDQAISAGLPVLAFSNKVEQISDGYAIKAKSPCTEEEPYIRTQILKLLQNDETWNTQRRLARRSRLERVRAVALQEELLHI